MPPNVLQVVADDLGWADVGFNGGRDHIDVLPTVLAAAGVTPPALELYDLATDPGETRDLAAREPERVRDLHAGLREFGTWQQPGVGAYSEGREGFRAPKDWIIDTP